jgi:hypothetical protein
MAATRLGKWAGRTARKTLKVVSTGALRSVLAESGLSLTTLKDVAKTKAVEHAQKAADKITASQKLAIEGKSLKAKADALNHALDELDSAE